MNLNELPNELIARVGRLLPAADLGHFERTSKATLAALRSGDRSEATAAWHRDTYGSAIPPRLPDRGAHAGPAWRSIVREAQAHAALPAKPRDLAALAAGVDAGACEPAIAGCQPFSALPTEALAEAQLVHRALSVQGRSAEAEALHHTRIAPQVALEAALDQASPGAVKTALDQGGRVDWACWQRALAARAPRTVFDQLDGALEAPRDSNPARRVVCEAATAQRWEVVTLAARGLDELPRALRDTLSQASSDLLETLAPVMGADAARVLGERLPPMPTRRAPPQPRALPSAAALQALLAAAKAAPPHVLAENAIATGLHGLLSQGGAEAAMLVQVMLEAGVELHPHRALYAVEACIGDPLPTLRVLLADAAFRKAPGKQDLLVTLATRPTPDALPCLDLLLQAGAEPRARGRGPHGLATPLAAAEQAGCAANVARLQQG